MSVSQFRVTCDSYKNNVCLGFSLLQQNQEFVDMTLAVDGHFVKVHQSLVALCSPYIKEILKSITGQHPVIILNNVSYEILCFILEYIYTGEVQVPSEKIDQFFKAAKTLHLSGIDHLDVAKDSTIFGESSVSEANRLTTGYTVPHITINPANSSLEHEVGKQDGRSYVAKQGLFRLDVDGQDLNSTQVLEKYIKDGEDTNEDLNFEQPTIVTTNNVERRIANDENQEIDTLQYTVSNRGSLQMILNRFLYHMHHQANGGRRARWRCIDYRSMHCPAYVDTNNDIIINRKFMHSHPFHDSKILKKVQRDLVFSSTAKAICIFQSKQSNERESREVESD